MSPPPHSLSIDCSMKVTIPQSVPDGVSSSAGIMVSTAAAKNLALAQREIGCRFTSSRGSGGRSSGRLLRLNGSGWGKTRSNGGAGAQQEIAACDRIVVVRHVLVSHGDLPCLPRQSIMLDAATRHAPRGDV